MWRDKRPAENTHVHYISLEAEYSSITKIITNGCVMNMLVIKQKVVTHTHTVP